MGRAVVLLGAGASAPAGLPTSTALTTGVEQLLSSRAQFAAAASAFRWVVTDLARARQSTDIESVYQSVELVVEALTGRYAQTRPPLGWPAVASLVALIGTQPDLRRPTLVEQADPGLIRRAVCELLSPHGAVSYLDPILNLADPTMGLDVGTLNYDLTFEAAARARGGAYRVWYPADDVVPAGPIRLWKLHGSLDWTWTTESPSSPSAPPRWQVYRPRRGRDRAIIFGGGNKLTPHGPFLGLLQAWERALNDADHLLVVGYGFADPHVNETLTRWCWDAPGQRTVTVVTKGGRSNTDHPYLRELRSWLNGDTRPGGPYLPPDGHTRLVVLRGGADVDLARAVGRVCRRCSRPLPPATTPRPDRFDGRVGAQTIRNEYDSRRCLGPLRDVSAQGPPTRSGNDQTAGSAACSAASYIAIEVAFRSLRW